jgi:hypothetical protein
MYNNIAVMRTIDRILNMFMDINKLFRQQLLPMLKYSTQMYYIINREN